MPVSAGTEQAAAACARGPLAGVVVLDVTHVMAGSYCGLLLAQMGADVVKVERAGGGDDLRQNQSRTGGWLRPWDAVNHTKRSLALDLADPRGAEVLLRMAERADVFVENYRPGALERLGLGYRELSRRNPALVHCSITGFGGSGPYRERPGFDLVAQAMSGLMSLTGEPGRPPVAVGVPIADLNAGTFAALGILSAYVHRLASGEGQHVDTSLFESALAYTVWESCLLFDTGTVPEPMAAAHRLSAAYGAYATADGWLVVAAGTQPTWERLCAALDREDLPRDPRFHSHLERLRHRTALDAELRAAFAAETTDTWVQRLLGHGVPCGPVQNLERAHEDPQARSREMSVAVGTEADRPQRVIGAPVKLSRTPWRVGAPSAYGADGAEVLAEFGFGAEEIRTLARAGVLDGGTQTNP